MPTNGLFSANADGLRGLETDEQRVRQTRPLRGGDGVQLSDRNSGCAQRRLRDGNQIPQMFARGEFRHDAAVFGVELDLRGNDAGQNLAVANHRHAGFIAGSFDGEQRHFISRRDFFRLGKLAVKQHAFKQILGAVELDVAGFLRRARDPFHRAIPVRRVSV